MRGNALAGRIVAMRRRLLVAFLIVGMTTGAFVWHQCVRPRPAMLDWPLTSVQRRTDSVLAAGYDGLYCAALRDRIWREVRLVPGMPAGGHFADEPPDAPDVYYFINSTPIQFDGIPALPGLTFGLYRSRDGGGTWQLVLRHDGFASVYLHPNGTLYAMCHGPVPGTPGRGEEERLCASINGGKSWRDISRGLPLGTLAFPLFEKFQLDPARPNLACVTIAGFGSSFDRVYHAADLTYQWVPMDEGMFSQREYFTRGYAHSPAQFSAGWSSSYVVDATLRNYFDDGFEAEISLCILQAVPDQARYSFSASGPKLIRFEVRFLRTTGQLKLLDGPGNDCWSIRAVGPDGNLGGTPAVNEEATDTRQATVMPAVTIDHGHPYARQIYLDGLKEPGIYKAQLRYESQTAGSARGEFVGGFGGPMFTIEISPSGPGSTARHP